MIRLDAKLLVGPRGPDLVASTARLTLVQKMGQAEQLAGLKRWDFFHLVLEATPTPGTLVRALTDTLARQSTFYNRNKHMYSLECRWDGGGETDGPSHEELKRQFGQSLGTRPGTGIDFDGKEDRKADIVKASPVFLVEVFVQDDDSAGRNAIAAKLTRELSGAIGDPVRVQCPGRATVWWLGIATRDEAAAMETARRITVTKRRAGSWGS